MNMKAGSLYSLLVLFVCSVFTDVSQGIDLNPAKEQIDEAIKIGEANPGKKVFETELVKPAIFGKWPEYSGGLIKTRLVNLAIMSAMKRKARKALSEEETAGIMESDVLAISYRGGDDVFRIILKQGGRVIEPAKMTMPEAGDKDAGEHAVFFTASFPYSRLDLNAKATLVIIRDYREEEYEVDFSVIK